MFNPDLEPKSHKGTEETAPAAAQQYNTLMLSVVSGLAALRHQFGPEVAPSADPAAQLEAVSAEDRPEPDTDYPEELAA